MNVLNIQCVHVKECFYVLASLSSMANEEGIIAGSVGAVVLLVCLCTFGFPVFIVAVVFIANSESG